MKKVIYAFLGLTVLIASSCKKDTTNHSVKKELISGGASGVDTLEGAITLNTTVVRTTYLKGVVSVQSGVTLTINPGVTIVGSPGPVVIDTINAANNKGILIITQGARIIANGTPAAPIVWTSSFPAGFRHSGDWGGLVLLGKATIHTETGGTTDYFLGLIFTPFFFSSFGGTDDADNSGSITYNRFEFGGGARLFPNQGAVNAVAFCGVGSATVVHHLEASGCNYDGFAFFGGAVNAHHLISYNVGDDEFDFDEGYHGKLQFIIGYRLQNTDNGGSHGIESDNDFNGTNLTPHTQAFISNATLVGPVDLLSSNPNGFYDGEIYCRRNSRMRLLNSLIISQAQPYAIVTSPTTQPRVASTFSLTSDDVLVACNIFQTNSAHPVYQSSIEGEPIVGNDDPVTFNKLTGLNNTSLTTYSDFKLDGTLTPVAGSPALSGGFNLSASGFLGTSERGAVITGDHWTSGTEGAWISTATN